jgi:hypothetical protein
MTIYRRRSEETVSNDSIESTLINVDEDTEKILGLLDISGILIPYIYTLLYTACREELSCENSS